MFYNIVIPFLVLAGAFFLVGKYLKDDPRTICLVILAVLTLFWVINVIGFNVPK